MSRVSRDHCEKRSDVAISIVGQSSRLSGNDGQACPGQGSGDARPTEEEITSTAENGAAVTSPGGQLFL